MHFLFPKLVHIQCLACEKQWKDVALIFECFESCYAHFDLLMFNVKTCVGLCGYLMGNWLIFGKN